MSRRGVIFDGDDTLWETQSLYNAAKREFFLEMEEAGFNREEVERRFESIDQANVAKFGFSRRRFPQSMRDTYHQFCEERSMEIEPRQLSQMSAIGESVFVATPSLYSDATKILETLRSAGFTLILATKGDPEIQDRRILTSGLKSYFDGVHIFEEKGVREFSDMVSEWRLDTKRSWSVGNSPRSDISPALAVGLNAIWIRKATWVYEEEDLGVEERLTIATSLREVCSIILRERA